MAERDRARRPRSERARDPRTADDAAAARIRDQARWVDLQVQGAIERGEFDNLSGAGKPLTGLGSTHDPDWWVKRLIEREQITGVLPAALQLRKDDAALESELDEEPVEDRVREIVADFNRRVVEARRQLQGGPPVITSTRDVEAEVAAWQERRLVRRTPPRDGQSPQAAEESGTRSARSVVRLWFRRRSRS